MEYTKGEGTSEKPQGEAKALNDASMGQGAPDPMNDPGPPIPLQRPQPLPPPPGGEDSMLFGPTSRPNQPVGTQRNASEVPAYIYEALPALVRAAQMPDASPTLKALVRLLDTHINRTAGPR